MVKTVTSGPSQYANGSRAPRSQRETSWRLTVGVPAAAQRWPASVRCDIHRRRRAAAIIVPGEANTGARSAVAEIVADPAIETSGMFR
jgi:hypothetical protein